MLIRTISRNVKTFSLSTVSATVHPSPPPEPPPSATSAAIANLILTSEPQTLSKTLLESPNYHWSEPLVNETLKRLWNHGPKTLEFFNILDQHRHYSHSLSSFNLAVDVAGRLRDFDCLWSLVDRLKSRRLGPTRRTFAIIIESGNLVSLIECPCLEIGMLILTRLF